MSVGTPGGGEGPHVFVADLDKPELTYDDRHHLERVLRLRSGDPLTVSDGFGRWRSCSFGDDIELLGEVIEVPKSPSLVVVGVSILKGGRLELVVQKLTELGVDRILLVVAERSTVHWDFPKQMAQQKRLSRVSREAAMQSKRVYLPLIEPLRSLSEIRDLYSVRFANPGGRPLKVNDRLLLIGPEGGWTPEEVDGYDTVDLGPNILRAETAAIAAGTLLTALRDRRLRPGP